MQPLEAVRLDSHAFATLRYIRASMEAAASLAVPGSAGIVAGIIGSLAAALSALPVLRAHWLAIWLVAAVLTGLAGSTLLVRRSSASGLTLAGAPLRKFAIGLVPSLIAGAAMTAVHWRHGNLQAIPGTWLMLYGCGLVSASVATGRSLGILGAAFIALGAVALLLPEDIRILVLGLGFGGLHLAFGLVMRRVDGGR